MYIYTINISLNVPVVGRPCGVGPGGRACRASGEDCLAGEHAAEAGGGRRAAAGRVPRPEAPGSRGDARAPPGSQPP